MDINSKISDFMTKCPETIEPGATVAKALEVMEKNGFRHMPVVENNKAIGILSEREIKRYETLMDTTRALVVDVMLSSPYTVEKSCTVEEVVTTMADKKIGSAIIKGQGNHIVGIFTTTDALDLFAKTLSL